MDSIGNYVFDKRDLLGNGAFAIVFKGHRRQDPKHQVAVKCVAKKELNKTKELLTKEIRVLRELSNLQHENLVSLLDVTESDSTVYLILEYCNGGDLSSYLAAQGTMSEDALSAFMQQIARALLALDQLNIVHRDIKPQNILICLPKGGSKKTTPPTHLIFKLADFGFARFLEEGVLANTLCGSPMYMAPEVILSEKYWSQADLWSVGTIVFQCLTGRAPFSAKDPQGLRDYYATHPILNPKVPDNASPEMKNMLQRLLTRDPNRRMTISEMSDHPFLKKVRLTSSRRGHTSSPIPSRRQTPSLSSESSSPGSNREVSPHARQVGEVGDMVNTLTGSNDDDHGFTKVEKPDTRPHSPDDFEIVPNILPDYNSSGERRGKVERAPLALAEEEYDAFDESLTSSSLHSGGGGGGGIRIHSDGRAHYRKGDDSYQHQRLPSPVSSSPSPPLSQRSGGSSAPIPVPSISRLSAAGSRDGTGGGGGNVKSGGSPARVKKRSASIGERSDRVTGRRNSETALAAPDITQVAPPGVQFSIGTPPSKGTWKRSNTHGLDTVTTIPMVTGSPLRRSASCSPGTYFAHHTTTTTTTATNPTIGFNPSCPCHHPPHSPHHHYPSPPSHHHQQQQQQHPYFYHQHQYHHHQHYAAQDPYAYHDSNFHRYPTVPDCTALVPVHTMAADRSLETYHRCGTEPDLRSASPFNPNVFMRTAAFPPHLHTPTHPGLGALVPWSGAREPLNPLVGATASTATTTTPTPIPTTAAADGMGRQSPCAQEHGGLPYAASAPLLHQRRGSMMGGDMPQSPRSLDHPPPSAPPMPDVSDLSEDTLMTKEHMQTMARLRFILDVVDCVVVLAQSKGSDPITPMAESPSQDPLHSLHLPPKLAQSQRLVEQLVLYLRALQMMAQSIILAETEMKNDRLQYVNSLKKVLKQQNQLYLFCVGECNKLYEQLGSVCKPKHTLTPQLIVNTADKLIYNYAVQQCQAAALDELEGNHKESFHRYTTAQILLHSLAQLARNDHDRMLLQKYLHSVELRLTSMGGQEVHPVCLH